MVRKAMISAMDEAVGEIVTRLKKSEDWEKTVILFLSDNGSSVLSGNSPFRGGRGSPLEGGVRVPALVASPLLAEEVRGQTLSHMVHITDLAPTLLSLAGLEEITEMDGYNIWPALNNLISTERKVAGLKNAVEETRSMLDQADRFRRQLEQEVTENSDEQSKLLFQNTSLHSEKRRLEADIAELQVELEEVREELREREVRAKDSMMDASKIAQELHSEQEQSGILENETKNLETIVKNLHVSRLRGTLDYILKRNFR